MELSLSAIPGVSIGLILYLGEDLAYGDKFAFTIDFLLVRLTVVFPE